MATRAQLRAYLQTHRPDIVEWVTTNFTAQQINNYLDKVKTAIHQDALNEWIAYTINKTPLSFKKHEVLLCIGWAINRVP